MQARTLLSTAIAGVLFSGGAHALGFTLNEKWTHETNIFDESAAEIVAYDSASNRFFTTNGDSNMIDVINGTDGAKLFSIDPQGSPNSVAVKDGTVAIAVEATTVTDPGRVAFFDTNGNLVNSVNVGALPDMVTFTPDGNRVLVANEGEADGGIDPNGSISVIDISGGVNSATVSNIGFTDFNVGGSRNGELSPDVRLFAPGATVAQDLEPEYIAVSQDSTKAFVTLQENNSVAVVDLTNGTIDEIQALGYKDHSLPGNGLDPSDRDGGINIGPQPVFGMYMPDSIASYEVGGVNYYVTANEGDARNEDERVKDITLDPTAFPNAADLQQDQNLGRLEIATDMGDTDGDGDFDELYAYGTRSFTIWDETGNLVFDSGDDFEQITAALLPNEFNSNNDENGSFDARSDAKGPEPEAITIGEIDGIMLAFIGLERIGGIMIYDITDPNNPMFLNYINNRDFSVDAEDGTLDGTVGDLGPEGLLFIPAAENPFGQNLLAVSNEVSGTTTLFEIQKVPLPGTLLLMSVGLLALRRLRNR